MMQNALNERLKMHKREYLLYVALKTERYVQKHDLQLWEKSKSHSFRDRREAGKAMRSMSMQIPCLENCPGGSG